MHIDFSHSKALFICREYGEGRVFMMLKYPKRIEIYCYFFSVTYCW